MKRLRAALYARYSNGEQREKSIKDQIVEMVNAAPRWGFEIDPRLHYSDSAESGTKMRRADFKRMFADAKAGVFDVLFVWKLARFARNDAGQTNVLEDFKEWGVRVISVDDNCDCTDERDWMKTKFLGMANESYSRNTSADVKRGQDGARRSGYHCGDVVYGFRSVGSGAEVNRRGIVRPEGFKPEPDPIEAPIVLQVFTWLDEGVSENAIARRLNESKVPRRREGAGWTPGIISKMLRNTKYIDIWPYRQTKQIYNARSERTKTIARPRSEWDIRSFGCPIVPKDLFDRVQEKLALRARSFVRAGKKGFARKQDGYVKHYPTSLLSGSMKCGVCGYSIGKAAGKGDGYFGCLRYKTKLCSNRILVPRQLAERLIVRAVRDQLEMPGLIDDVFRRAFSMVKKLRKEQPDRLSSARAELQEHRKVMGNYVRAIAMGNQTDALNTVMKNTEIEIMKLERQVAAMEKTFGDLDKPPPRAWVEGRVHDFKGLLERRTAASALALRDVLGEIRLTPVYPDIGRAYYRAETRLGLIELIESPAIGTTTPPADAPKTVSPKNSRRRAKGASDAEHRDAASGSTSFTLLRRRDSNP